LHHCRICRGETPYHCQFHCEPANLQFLHEEMRDNPRTWYWSNQWTLMQPGLWPNLWLQIRGLGVCLNMGVQTKWVGHWCMQCVILLYLYSYSSRYIRRWVILSEPGGQVTHTRKCPESEKPILGHFPSKYRNSEFSRYSKAQGLVNMINYGHSDVCLDQRF